MRIRRFLWRLGRETKGIASVEFVIIMFPMLLIFFGMLQFGSLFYNYSHMQNVARDVARRLAVDTNLDPGGNGALVTCPGTAGTSERLACDLIDLPGTIQASGCYDNVEGAGPAHNGPSIRMDANITIVAPMSDISLVDLLGVGDGLNVTARATMRIQEPKILLMDGVADDTCPF